MAWERIYDQEGIGAVEPALVSEWASRLARAGFSDANLHGFTVADLAADLPKHRLLLAYNMGLGKTRAAIAAAAARGTKHSLFVVPNKLIGEWEREFAALGIGADELQVITSLAQINGYECAKGCGPVSTFQKVVDPNGVILDVRRECQSCGASAKRTDRLKRYNLISLRTLWTIPKDSPHAGREKKPGRKDEFGRVVAKERNRLRYSFAWYLRRLVEFVVVDEAYTLANPDALQTRAVFLLEARRRWLLTGTPVRGYPENVLSLLQWTLGRGSALFPDFDPTEENSVARFLNAFGTRIVKTRANGQPYEKWLPKISNAARFQALLAPVMRRRVNLEPQVAAAIRMPDFVITPEQVELDPNLRSIYGECVSNFVKWWEQAQAEAEREGTSVPQMTLLSKLTFLAQLAAVPQRAVASYEGISSKQARVIELAREAAKKGRKAIIFSEFADSAEWYANHPLLRDLRPTLITGSVSLARGKKSGTSERERRLTGFREGESNLLVATTTCMAEGLNVPQAGTVIFDSFGWVPSVQQQAWSRVLRPAQAHSPVEIFLVGTAGTIDDYLSAINALKRASISEGIDYETVEIDLDDVPDPMVYAHSLVEASTAVGKTYGALAWIERLKKQAAAA